jgi:hypothetical protein
MIRPFSTPLPAVTGGHDVLARLTALFGGALMILYATG